MSGDLELKLLSRLTEGPHQMVQAEERGLKPEMFEDPMNRAAFVVAREYWMEHQMEVAATITVLEHELPGLKLPSLDAGEESSAWLTDFLKRRFASNRFQEIVRDASVLHQSDPTGALKQLYADAYAANELVVASSVHVDMATNIESRRERYEERAANEGLGGTGVTLGIDVLDDWVSGLRKGELCAVGAFSKVGKTMFLVNAAVKAREQGYTPAIFSLEMSKQEIEDRVDAMASGVSYNRFTKGLLTAEEYDTWHRSQEFMAALGSIHVFRPDEGDRTSLHMAMKARQVGADYLIIDQLSFMETRKRTRNLKEEHAAIIKELKTEIGRSGSELPCLLAVQLNRQSLDQKEGPALQNFANATEIEQTVDLALGLSRNADERNNNVMRLYILGCRRAGMKQWLLQWHLLSRTHISLMNEIMPSPAP